MNEDGDLEVVLEQMFGFYEIAARLSFVIADKQPIHIAPYSAAFVSMPGNDVREVVLWKKESFK